jgi:hypothetical protein
MPPKKFTRTHLRITNIHESDDTLQAAASTAERTTPTVVPEAEIDIDDDLYCDLVSRRSKDSPIHIDRGDLRSQITDKDHLDMATQNWFMLEMLLENQAQWETEQSLDRERMAAQWEHNAAERDECAAKHTECTERSSVGPRPNIYKMLDPEMF